MNSLLGSGEAVDAGTGFENMDFVAFAMTGALVLEGYVVGCR